MKVVVAAVSLVVIAAACSSNSSGGTAGTSAAPGAQGGTYSLTNCEPNTSLIPQNNYESCGSQVFEALFTRLMTYDEAGAPIPAQAESVTASPDGLVYTIKIKSGWTFHNGDPVDAKSYVDAWNYAADCTNGYILNTFFQRIEGYDALNPSDCKNLTTTELSGLAVVDDTTFTVTLTAPFSQFPTTLGFDAYDPLPQAFFDDPEAFNQAPIGDGPYMMDGKWKHDETINLQRYPDYAGTPGYADKIELLSYPVGGDAYWADFQAGNVDIAIFGSAHLAEAQSAYADSLQRSSSSSFFFLGFPTYDSQFQSKELRQALSMAVDRQAVMTAILINESPADDLISPSILGYRQGACKYCTLDVAGAQQKLADAGGWTGTMELNIYADDPVLEQAAEAITNQWKENLGIDAKINAVPYNTWYGNTVSKKWTGPWFLDGWVMDYPSMEDYLTPLYAANGAYASTGYSNPQFEDLMKQGDEAPSVEASIPLYQQADDLVLEDMPVIPWGYGNFNTVNLPTVTNVVKDGPLDTLALELVQVVSPS
jgi:ABC-type oligopeptide transport system substrate-binding subunit